MAVSKADAVKILFDLMDGGENSEQPPELKVHVPPYGKCEIRWSSQDKGPLSNLYEYEGPCVIEVFTD
jgi:hypothetical protein